MRKNVLLPPLRIDSELHTRMKRTLEELNRNNPLLELKLPVFRRLSYEHFCKTILAEGLQLAYHPPKKT